MGCCTKYCGSRRRKALNQYRKQACCFSARAPADSADCLDQVYVCGSPLFVVLFALLVVGASVVTSVVLMKTEPYAWSFPTLLGGQGVGVHVPSKFAAGTLTFSAPAAGNYCVAGPFSAYPSNMHEFRECWQTIASPQQLSNYKTAKTASWYMLRGSQLGLRYSHEAPEGHSPIEFAVIVTGEDMRNWVDGAPLKEPRHLVFSANYTETTVTWNRDFALNSSVPMRDEGEEIYVAWKGLDDSVTISTAVHASYAAVPQVSTLECTHEQGEEIELSYGNGFYILTLEHTHGPDVPMCHTTGSSSVFVSSHYKPAFFWGVPLSIAIVLVALYFCCSCYVCRLYSDDAKAINVLPQDSGGVLSPTQSGGYHLMA